MSKPLFSIVIPTRNRAKLLPLAVRSVLNQTFDDFEIIISDNFSSDETPQVAQSFGDRRIKYFRSEKSLSVGESFEFALTHAKGEFITFLSDDDAYAKFFLEIMLRVSKEQQAEIVTCKTALYFASAFFEYGRTIAANSLLITPFDRKILTLDREEAVSFVFDKFRLSSHKTSTEFMNIPQLVNTICHFSIIEKVKKRVPKLFPVVGGDVYTSVLFLNAVERFSYINEPLYLQTVWEESTTSGSQSIFERYPEDGKFDYVPLKKLLSLPNYSTNTVLRAKADWGDDYQSVSIEWSNYFISSHREIMYKKVHGIDVSEELEEFEAALSEQDEKLQKRVKLATAKYNLPKEWVKSKIKNLSVGKLLLKIKNKKLQVLSDLNNIVEYAEMIDESFLNKYANR